MTAATRMPSGRWRVVTGIGKHRTFEYFDTVEEASNRLQQEVYLSRGQFGKAEKLKPEKPKGEKPKT